MTELIGGMNALSVNGGNVNERGEFIVRGGPRNGPIVWNPTTAYIDSWTQLPLHPVNTRQNCFFKNLPMIVVCGPEFGPNDDREDAFDSTCRKIKHMHLRFC